jgi:hypothetical protein
LGVDTIRYIKEINARMLHKSIKSLDHSWKYSKMILIRSRKEKGENHLSQSNQIEGEAGEGACLNNNQHGAEIGKDVETEEKI